MNKIIIQINFLNFNQKNTIFKLKNTFLNKSRISKFKTKNMLSKQIKQLYKRYASPKFALYTYNVES